MNVLIILLKVILVFLAVWGAMILLAYTYYRMTGKDIYKVIKNWESPYAEKEDTKERKQ